MHSGRCTRTASKAFVCGGPYGYGVDLVGTDVPFAAVNDETGDPGTGKVVRPKGLAVPLAGADQTEWKSQQGLLGREEDGRPDGRRYDFVVDRNTQLWWPGDFQGGYDRGRWGPRVETDSFDRRAGMKFPRFWELFFYAYATGVSGREFPS